MDEDIIISDEIKQAFNLGTRLGETPEGRKKGAALIKGREDLPYSQALVAGIKEAQENASEESFEKKIRDLRDQQRDQGRQR